MRAHNRACSSEDRTEIVDQALIARTSGGRPRARLRAAARAPTRCHLCNRSGGIGEVGRAAAGGGLRRIRPGKVVEIIFWHTTQMPDEYRSIQPRRNPEDIDLVAIKTDLNSLWSKSRSCRPDRSQLSNRST